MLLDKGKPISITVVEQNQASLQTHIGPWSSLETQQLYAALELPNWAPWFAASAETLTSRSLVFPAGQLVMKNYAGEYLASLSLNQINWDGDPKYLPTWDEVAGEPTDYSETYTPHGDTLVLLSMNVAPAQQGKRLPSQMIAVAQKLAKSLGVDHLIGSFRPNKYGELKRGLGFIDFEEYCLMKKTGTILPFDPWLRSLTHMRMEMLAVDRNAMMVRVQLAEFERYKSVYKPNIWYQYSDSIWECGEVGNWKVDEKSGLATYKESNVWGRLPTFD